MKSDCNKRWILCFVSLFWFCLVLSAPASAQQPKLRLSLEQGDNVRSLTFSPNGKTLAAAYGGGKKTLLLFDVATGQRTATLPDDSTEVCAFSPDGRVLAIACDNGTIRLWEIASAKTRLVLPGHQSEGRAEALAFGVDGKIMVSTGGDVTRLWDLRHEVTVASWTALRFLGQIAYTSDAKILAAGGAGTKDLEIRLWEAASGKKVATIIGAHKFGVGSLSFSLDQKILASGGTDMPARPSKTGAPTLAREDLRDGVVKLWDATTGKHITTLEGHRGSVFAVAFSPDGKSLASASRDTTVKLWDLATGKNTATLLGHKDYVTCLAFSPDGKTLASGGKDKSIKLWELPLGQ